VIVVLKDSAAARPWYKESVTLCRMLVREQGTLLDLKLLAGILSQYAYVIARVKSPAAARILHKESVALCRMLVQKQGTPSSLENLAVVLSSYAKLMNGWKGPAAARPLLEESVAIRQRLAKGLAGHKSGWQGIGTTTPSKLMLVEPSVTAF